MESPAGVGFAYVDDGDDRVYNDNRVRSFAILCAWYVEKCNMDSVASRRDATESLSVLPLRREVFRTVKKKVNGTKRSTHGSPKFTARVLDLCSVLRSVPDCRVRLRAGRLQYRASICSNTQYGCLLALFCAMPRSVPAH